MEVGAHPGFSPTAVQGLTDESKDPPARELILRTLKHEVCPLSRYYGVWKAASLPIFLSENPAVALLFLLVQIRCPEGILSR